MKSVLLNLAFLTLLIIPSSYGQKNISPFTSIATTTQNNAKVANIEATISGNKIIVYWKVEENQAADLFELEKSTDGKNFIMAALIFGTDKQESDNYEFYEKTMSGHSISYRIKLINKNGTAQYSQTVQAKNNN